MIDPSHRAPSRRHVVAGLGSALMAAGACRGKADVVSSTSRPVRPLSDFGVTASASRDQWRDLQRATEAAHADRFDLVAEAGASYRHDGPLTFDGVSLDGRGCSFVAMSNGPQALHWIGSGFRVSNLQTMGAADTRAPDNWGNGLWIGGDDRPATDFVVENVVVDAVAPGRGVAGAGFMFNNAHRGRITRITARRTLSDGIHTTNGSTDLLFDHPLSEQTGDDGFAIVSYVPQGRLCRDIRVIDGVSRDSLARGFTVAGGRDIVIERARAERSSAAGIYLYGEQFWNTYGVARCRVIDPVLVNCGSGLHLPAGFQNAALIIGGREGEDRVDGEVTARGSSDCLVLNPTISGAGAACTAAISLHEFAYRPHIVGARLLDIISGNPNLPPNGIEIGGRDVVVENAHMTNIAGLAIVVLKTASGRCTIKDPRIVGTRLRSGVINSFVFVDAAKNLQRMDLQGGTFSHGPATLVVNALPDGSRLHTGTAFR